jgi:lipopolysaccharide/colanic/teichoic acid biosynthesis glycosyltransferase
MLYKQFGKRIFDILSSGLGLLVLSPIFILIGIMVWIKLGRPIFFMQVRPGLNAKPFTMVKFRTMKDSRDSSGDLLPDEIRLTKLGKFLRSTSLDELPELWNVLKGDMSLVGPRPLLMDYLAYFSNEQKKRHNVRPGITGLAQVNGRNAINWDQKLTYDVQYIEKISLLNDLIILTRTIYTVLSQRGIRSEKSLTSESFIIYFENKRNQSK